MAPGRARPPPPVGARTHARTPAPPPARRGLSPRTPLSASGSSPGPASQAPARVPAAAAWRARGGGMGNCEWSRGLRPVRARAHARARWISTFCFP